MMALVIRFGAGRMAVALVALVMICVGSATDLRAFLAGVFVCAAALWLDEWLP